MSLTKQQLLDIWDHLEEIDSGDNICQTFQHFVFECIDLFGVTHKGWDWDIGAWKYKEVTYHRGDERSMVENNEELFSLWSEELIEQAHLLQLIHTIK